jgi:hypothetical protein
MSDTWVGNILLTQETEVKSKVGDKVFDLLDCDGATVSSVTHPLLVEKLPVTLRGYDEVLQLTASDAETGDLFGRGVSQYDDRLVVGAHAEDTAASNAGKVYVYDWNGSSYDEVSTLTASDADVDDVFGVSVSVDGDRLAVGAYLEDTLGSNTGKVYIYDWNGSSYDEVLQLTASDAQAGDLYGISVALEGDRLVVGANSEDTGQLNSGKVYVYDWNGSSYDEVETLKASDADPDDDYGISLSINGDLLAIGAYNEDTAASNAGKVYVYDWDGSNYIEISTLTASDAQTGDKFGVSVAIGGDTLLVGAHKKDVGGKVYSYNWNGSSYDEITTLVASDIESGDRYGVSMYLEGDRLIVGSANEDTEASDAGKVYIYDVVTKTPNMTSPDPTVPYKIIADVT